MRSRLKSIITKFAYKFENKIIRFLLTKAHGLTRQISVSILYVSIESCGCANHCAWKFVVTKLSRMLDNSRRGYLGHLTAVPQHITQMEFKRSKCRSVSEFGIFYSNQLDVDALISTRRRYDLRRLPVRTYKE